MMGSVNYMTTIINMRAPGMTLFRMPLTIWSIVFLLVTLQMTTTLRPILGRSEVFLSQEKKFFLQHWGESSGKSLPKQPSKPADK
jgi:heme/copper-type cytochrome/quinol oxidase subunit 1